jgi:hypothetical protein
MEHDMKSAYLLAVFGSKQNAQHSNSAESTSATKSHNTKSRMPEWGDAALNWARKLHPDSKLGPHRELQDYWR